MDDIEQLIQLAEQEKWEEFEQLRMKLIEQAIGDDERAKKVQWRIETELNMCSNPTSRMIKIREMFYKQLTMFQMALQGQLEPEQSKILRFNKKEDD